MNRFLAYAVAVLAGLSAARAGAQTNVPPPVDPLDYQATTQIAAEAPGAQRIAPYFIGVAAKSDWNTLLEANKCYWFSGAGGPGIKKLSLYLWDPAKKRVADAKAKGAGATLAYCAATGGLYHLQARAGGNDRFIVGLFAKEVPPEMVPQPKEKPDLAALCDKEAAAAAPGAVRQGEFFDGSSGRMEHNEWATALEAGTCYWFIAVGEPRQVKELGLFLWGPDRKRITESKSSTNHAVIGHCANATGMFKVQAKVLSGSGDYKLAVYRKPQ
jgi:hypothetical protein